MEICQHCGMYMKPIMPSGPPTEGKDAGCEFCRQVIATIEKREDGKLYWKKAPYKSLAK